MKKKILAIIIIGCCLLSGVLGFSLNGLFAPTRIERVEIPIFSYDSFENAAIVINESGYILNYTVFKKVTSPCRDFIHIHDSLYGVVIGGKFTLVDLAQD